MSPTLTGSLVPVRGPAGTDGVDGTNGTNGTNGVDGVDADDAAITAAVTATVSTTIQEDRGAWYQSRAVDAASTTAIDDTPTIAWTNSITSNLTTPVLYRPIGGGAGTKTTSTDGTADTTFRYDSGLFETANGANQDLAFYGLVKPDANTAHKWPVSPSFTTSAVSVVELAFYGAATSGQVVIEVNGLPVSDKTIWAPPTFTTGHMFLTLTFPTAQVRTIRARTTGGLGFYGVRVPTGGTLTKPASSGRRWAFIGDSFVNGAGESRAPLDKGTGFAETFALRLARMVAAGDFINAGIGGSGWTVGGSGSKYGSRVAQVVAFAPDVIVFYGSTNDGTDTFNATGGLATIDTEVRAALDACSGVAEVYVIGPLRHTVYENVNDTIKAATEAKGRVFLDLRGFIYGTGKVTAQTGVGNADFYLMDDGVHPTFGAHQAIARKLLALLATS